MKTFTIGCDPEIFVRDENGNPVSAHGMIEGTKEKPFKVDDGAVQVDGLALEINVNPVTLDLTAGTYGANESFEEFNRRIMSVLGQLKKMLPKGHTFDIIPSRRFDKAYYDTLPDEAKILGCDPDFNAWRDGEMNPRPNGDDGLRGAAGHIHLGWGKNIPVNHPEHMEICSYLVRNLDRSVGCAMLVIDPDEERRKVYGRAGAFRPKDYGVEYRTPSNVWLRTKANRKLIWGVLYRALLTLTSGKEIADFIGISAERIINENMRGEARNQASYAAAHSVLMPQLVKELVDPRERVSKAARRATTEGGLGK